MCAGQAFSWCQDIRKIEAKNSKIKGQEARHIRAFEKAADRAQRARGHLPRSTAAGDDTLRNRIEPMEEEGAVGQRSRRSPSPRRSPPAVGGVLVGDEGGDIESRRTHVTWEEWAMSGNDARYDADSAVLVAAKQKAALQEHAKMQWLACFDSALSAAEVGLERVGVDAD
ncbi:hypothetical protein EMIHUDRAFT_228419 [Emiliania huxleyi CCMP1516]|uniref:Uncharacterized protein n=2 Tax=Emiliania huxleyi TaxID=2903 RepID=A0A0D3KFW9_EMIH1|nr:hypothetical protein EMIHUDRAFT_228419 [Emiliania huxleyi CCMP1516]EOD34654.1 hypothetical protein EMIHUDRAFT_228419 [Emiliania huxleyi CCMP1516]|eukprot:XP_005787083.1 hypothetical protein EMIHUDRAFT_228419 [Emiliania huxleyi CCMP1516]